MPPEDGGYSEQEIGQTPDTEIDSPQPEEEEVQEDAGEESGDEQPQPPQQPAAARDPYQDRFDRYERDISQLKAALQYAADQQQQQRPLVPECLRRPDNTWTVNDWREYNQFVMRQELEAITAEQQWRGRLSAASLGPDNDYDTVVEKYLYQNRELQADPTSMNFVRQLGPLEKYALGVVHEMVAHAKGDPVKAFKAIRNSLGARLEGARDIQKAVNRTARDTSMKLLRGGRQAAFSGNTNNAWDLSEADFRQLVSRKGS